VNAELLFDAHERRDLLRAGRRTIAGGVGLALTSLTSPAAGPLDHVIELALLVVAISLWIAGRRLRVLARSREPGELHRALWHLRNALAIKCLGLLVFVASVVLVVLAAL